MPLDEVVHFLHEVFLRNGELRRTRFLPFLVVFDRGGGFRAFDLDQAPREVIDIAVRAARPIGEGFYGVDLKQTDNGIVVMEVNDNPNLEHGIEDTVGKDEIWIRLLKWFTDRFEQ